METHSATQAVEAALFSAGRPVSVEDLAETTGYTRAQVREALEGLRRGYGDRETALEVSKAGEKWAMQLRTAYAEGVRKLAPMEVPEKTLKTLALIAYHQPVLQSDLQDMVGSKVYDHVGELKDLGLVRKRRHERSYMLRTTPEFAEYFGIESTDDEEIRRYLAERVGIPLPADDGRGNRTLPSYEGAEDDLGGEGEPPEETAGEDLGVDREPQGRSGEDHPADPEPADGEGPEDAGQTPPDDAGGHEDEVGDPEASEDPPEDLQAPAAT